MLKRTSVRQAVFAVVCVLSLGAYVAAKVDFFANYFRLGPEAYLRKHSVYWAAIAALEGSVSGLWTDFLPETIDDCCRIAPHGHPVHC